jgi:hypothetical protein
MVEMIRGAETLNASWFTGGPALTPLEQIGVYRNQYRLRLHDALADEVPGFVAMVGDGAEPLLRAYLFDCPSGSWTLNRISYGLVAWLEQRMCPARFVDMARLDVAVQQGYEAAGADPVPPEAFATMPKLALQAHVTLLRLSHNVHWLRSAALMGKPVPEPEQGDYGVVVFRRGIKMRHWEMPKGAFAILEAIDAGKTVPESIDVAFSQGMLNAETLAADIGQWFKDYTSRDLVRLAAD